jgi:hypothetical protein
MRSEAELWAQIAEREANGFRLWGELETESPKQHSLENFKPDNA